MAEKVIADYVFEQVGAGTFDWSGWTIRAALFDDTLTPDPADDFMDDISGEIDDSGESGNYARQTLGSKVAESATVDSSVIYRWTAAAVEWSSEIDDGSDPATQVEWMVLFREVTDDTDSPILGYFQIRRSDDSVVELPIALLEVPPDTDEGFISLQRPSGS